MRWHSEASEYLPKKGAADGDVCLLKIDEAQDQRLSVRSFVAFAPRISYPWLKDAGGTHTALPVATP